MNYEKTKCLFLRYLAQIYGINLKGAGKDSNEVGRLRQIVPSYIELIV